MKRFAGIMAIAMLALVLMGCPEKKKGPMEKAGEKIDHAAGDVKDAVKDAADDVEDAVDHK